MTYEEYIEFLRDSGIEGIEPYVTAAQETYDGLTNGANARIAELETANDALQRQLTETQAKNYTLMIAATAKQEPTEPAGDREEITQEEKDVTTLFAK